jgi:hypothetical protein
MGYRMSFPIVRQTLHIDYESAALRIHVQAKFFVQERLNLRMKRR